MSAKEKFLQLLEEQDAEWLKMALEVHKDLGDPLGGEVRSYFDLKILGLRRAKELFEQAERETAMPD